MSAGKKVFIVGPGFIGLNVLDNLVSEGYTVTGSVRRDAAAEQLRSLGASAIVADLHDHDAIAKQVAESDIVFHTATADDLPSVEAILDGIRTRAARGQHTIYIHNSGAAVFADKSHGDFASDKIYHDDVLAEWDAIPDSAPHRQIDLTILRTQRELGDKATMAIMLPPLIYGYNPKHDRQSIQLPALVRFAQKHGFAGHIGAGKAVWSTVHVVDLGRAYMTLLHSLETPAGAAAARENPYFYAANTGGDASWGEFAAAIGEALKKAGKIDEAAPKTVPRELYGDLWGDGAGIGFGSNARTQANRLRELGWETKEKDWRASLLEDELPVLLK